MRSKNVTALHGLPWYKTSHSTVTPRGKCTALLWLKHGGSNERQFRGWWGSIANENTLSTWLMFPLSNHISTFQNVVQSRCLGHVYMHQNKSFDNASLRYERTMAPSLSKWLKGFYVFFLTFLLSVSAFLNLEELNEMKYGIQILPDPVIMGQVRLLWE